MPALISLLSGVILVIATLFSPLAASLANGEPIRISEINHFIRAIEHLETFHDTERKETPQSIEQTYQQGKFSRPDTRVAGLGLTRYPVWLRYEIVNDSETRKDLVLEYIDHGLAKLELYSVANGQQIYAASASYYDVFDSRPIEHFRYAFPISIEARQSTTVFVKLSIESAGPLFADMRIWNARSFERFSKTEAFALGTFFGMLLLMLLVSMVSFAVVRHRVLLYYIGYLIASLYVWGSITGFLPEFFFRGGYHWMHMIIGGAITVSFASLFTRSLLNTRKHTLTLDRLILALAAFGLVPLIAAYMQRSDIAVIAMNFQLFGTILLIIAGVRRALQGKAVALVFSIVWSLYLIGMVIYPLRELGFIDHTPLTYWIGPIGAIVESSLLMGIIALWIYNNQKLTMQARQAYLDGLEEQKRKLQLQVDERTLELKKAKETAEIEARTDSLTRLPNRRYLNERLSKEISRSRRKNIPLGLLIIDLDHFKQINDEYGHHTGDEALKMIAEIVRQHIRPYDVLARVGGEEFVLMMVQTDFLEAQSLSERILNRVRETPLKINEVSIPLRFTGGLTMLKDCDDMDSLVQRADRLLYQGKSNGRDCIESDLLKARHNKSAGKR